MNKVPTHSEKLLSIRIPDRKDLDPCIEEVREKETSRFYTGQEMTPPPFPVDESKTKRKHIQSFLSHMADMKNIKASSRGDSTKKLTVLSKSKSKLQLNSSSIQGKPSSKDLDLISQSHSAKLAPSVSASGQPNLRLPKQSTVSDDQTDLNTSQCRSALSNMRSASAANEFALPSSFFIYKKKLFSFGKKTLSFSPFNATTITPKLCGFEPFDAFCENGCVILLPSDQSSAEEGVKFFVTSITQILIPSSTTDFARKRQIGNFGAKIEHYPLSVFVEADDGNTRLDIILTSLSDYTSFMCLKKHLENPILPN